MLGIDQSRYICSLISSSPDIDGYCQVGSHYLFLETNPALIFDRLFSYGTHLDIAAGTAVRFEPGERKTVSLVGVGGSKHLSGGSGLGSGPFEEAKRESVVREMVEKGGFGHRKQESVQEGQVAEMDREVVSRSNAKADRN